MNHELYKHSFVINYNTAQTLNAGNGIFMHVARLGTGYTAVFLQQAKVTY